MSRTTFFLALGSAALLSVGVLVVVRARNRGRPPVGPESVVLLGDSITAEGEWATLLPDWPVVPRGVSGLTSAQLVPVASEVGERAPQAVFVLAGTNDIRDGHPTAWTERHLGEIIDRLQVSAPDTIIVGQTLLPRADQPEAVRAANEMITRLATERDVGLLDLHTPFHDGSGGVRPAETTDGIHLSETGYQRWAGLLDRAFRDFSVSADTP